MNNSEFMVQPQLLISLGWHWSEGHFDKCQVCRQRFFYQYGWRSPKFAFYHDRCLANSKRYYKIVKKYQRSISCQKYQR